MRTDGWGGGTADKFLGAHHCSNIFDMLGLVLTEV